MEDSEFDRALVAAFFELAAEKGWERTSVTAAARRAGLRLDRARARFPGRPAVLLRFGRIADAAALSEASTEGTERDRLFDLVMRRIDVLQSHRAGVLALLRSLPSQPLVAMMLTAATLGSMAWLLEAAGISAQGLRGQLRTKGMLGVWLCTVRAWRRDTTEDLSATMSALDRALSRAEQTEQTLCRRWRSRSVDPVPPDPVPPDAPGPMPPAPIPPDAAVPPP